MIEFFYTALLIGSGASVGMALVMTVLYFRLYQRQPRPVLRALAATKFGIAISNGTLLVALAGARSADPNPPDWRGWTYLLGLITITVGLAFEAKYTIETLAVEDAEK